MPVYVCTSRISLLTERMVGKTLREAINSRSPLIRDFLPTFCATISPNFRYRFYLGHDVDDRVFSKDSQRKEFSEMFTQVVKEKCKSGIPIELAYVTCSHKGV